MEFVPVEKDRWSDFETLFRARGACGGCWCMLWRLTRKEFESQKGEGNRLAMKALIQSGAKYPEFWLYLRANRWPGARWRPVTAFRRWGAHEFSNRWTSCRYGRSPVFLWKSNIAAKV